MKFLNRIRNGTFPLFRCIFTIHDIKHSFVINTVSGKKLSEIAEDIRKEYGEIHMEERAYRFTAEEKERIHKTLMMDQALPEIPFEIDHVYYMDGCKVYLKNGGWVSARFSGTEPLLRIFCEMQTEHEAVLLCEVFEKFLGL